LRRPELHQCPTKNYVRLDNQCVASTRALQAMPLQQQNTAKGCCETFSRAEPFAAIADLRTEVERNSLRLL
jgi:hypothetical protein